MNNYPISQLTKAPWLVDFSCIMRFMMLLPPVFTEHFEATNDENTAFRDECRKFLGGLKKANITPIVVFDGKRSATKEEEGAKRDQARKEAEEAINMLQQADNNDDAGKEAFRKLARKAMGLSELFLSIAIQVCKEMRIQFRPF